MNNPTIDGVFSQLDEWRGFPAYQLERRADIYFALFLPFVLKERFELASEPDLIPEFPLRHGTLGTDATATGKGKIGKSQSVKVDYAAVSRDDGKVFLVELKTDMASKRPAQDAYLQAASKKTFKELVGGVYEIRDAATGEAKRKYTNLIRYLEKIVVDELPQGMKPQVAYVQPKVDTEQISFLEFAKVIRGRGEIADRFAESLKKWQEPPA